MAEREKRPLTVDEALAQVLADVTPLADAVDVDLLDALGCVLAGPLLARHTQPPFAASAMDGYAVRAADVRSLPVTLLQIGEAAAGHAFAGQVNAGEAVRIFTGAPMPRGADAVVIQENTSARDGCITIAAGAIDFEHVRPQGGDFSRGDPVLAAGQLLSARHLTLAAAAGHPRLAVRRKPVVAILATGDELVLPGETPRGDQIVCSNPFGVAAMVRAAGGQPHLLGIADDTSDSLDAKIAEAGDADILVTLGGASVGDHDLVGPVLAQRGMALAFWKIAMRPGKPMMFGRLGAQRVLGLPGNPVSSMITARLFLVPLIHALLGRPDAAVRTTSGTLASPLPGNGPRAHYMRAVSHRTSAGNDAITPLSNQDSSLLMPLAEANCLIVRPPGAPALSAGSEVSVLPLDF
jgi:molybdopterin molybdotransferase